jgi:hypothetical protein
MKRQANYTLTSILLVAIFLFGVSGRMPSVAAAGPAITVTSPSGAPTWHTGSSYNITWTNASFVSVRVDISLYSGGDNYSSVSYFLDNTGSFNWTIPGAVTPGTQYQIYIVDNANVNSWGESGIFTIANPPPSFTITSPKGNPTWYTGSSYLITWKNVSVSPRADISLYSGGENYSIIQYLDDNTGSYNWTIPSATAPGTSYQIYILDNANPDTNALSLDFTIANPSITVTSPISSDSWVTGSNHDITWTSDGTSGYLNIDLYSGGTLVFAIADDVANNGSYAWTLPSNVTAGNYSIYIVDYSNTNLHGSSAAFAITSPSGKSSPGYDVTLSMLSLLVGALGVLAVALKKHQMQMQ